MESQYHSINGARCRKTRGALVPSNEVWKVIDVLTDRIGSLELPTLRKRFDP
jgi:hypothetical protein